MESAKDILFELRHKEKKISDLVRFLSIRCDETPNYSLLMGAGCSITSGIKSGTQLINDWKKEIIEYADDYDTSITSDEYFEKQNWFDERNPYSSLFEKRYDLQRQRRAFVENEVANKNPSIGYAYLVKLIENNYFNAIFTTNFDDLLNEAFYRFSNVRPVVCAHDSAITSITVTSKRPKIIKLHGDYLFEDIKSTLRETESLEGNMKNKFIEFSKDYGLIVVGYAGNDRSIMDILSFLLKKEEFFKNGIYWCIRKGDENISDDLKKLLWKDKVFFIQIEGFDELMAELNKRLNKGVLPIGNAILSSEHQIKLIKSLTSNEYVEKSNSKIIQEDSKRLKKMVNHNIFEDFFKHVDVKKEKKDNTTRKDSSPKISEEEKKTLNKVRILFLEDETEQAYKLINEQKLEDSDNSSYKAELLEMKLALLHNMNLENNIEYKQTIDSLIAIKPNTEMYYIEAVNSFPEIKDKIEYIDKAIAIYPNDYSLYRKKGDFMADYYNSLINKEESDIAPNAITTCYLTSIKLDGSIFNKAWVNLCDWYSHLYKKENEKKKEEILSLLKKYKEQNEYHPNYLKVCHRYSNMINEKIDKLLINGYSFAKQTDDPTWVESTVLILLDYFEEKDQKNELTKFMEEFEKEYNPSYDYLLKKATIFAKKFDNIAESIKILEDIENGNYFRNNMLIKLYAIIQEKEKAQIIVDKYNKIDHEILILYNLEFEEYETVCNLIEKYWETHKKDVSTFVSYSYAKLKLKQYKEIYWDLKQYYDNPQTCIPEIAINYFIADIKLNKLDDKKIKNKILNNKDLYDNDVIAAAYSLIGDIPNALDYLSKAIKDDNLLKYSVRDWPAFENCKNDNRYQRIIGIA